MVMAVMMVVMMMNIHLEAQDERINDSSTSAAQIVVEFDGVDAGGGAIGKSVKKSSKSRRIIKKSEKPQRPEKLQRSSVRKNVYRSTNLPSI